MGALTTLNGLSATTRGPEGTTTISFDAVSWGLRFFGIGLILMGITFSRSGMTHGFLAKSDKVRPVYWLGLAVAVIAILVIYFSFIVARAPFASTPESVTATIWGLALSGIGLILTGVALLRHGR